jgi:hypothetical protein
MLRCNCSDKRLRGEEANYSFYVMSLREHIKYKDGVKRISAGQPSFNRDLLATGILVQAGWRSGQSLEAHIGTTRKKGDPW